MAKNTKAQEAATGTSDSYTAHELTDENPPPRISRAMLGDVDRKPDEMHSGERVEGSDRPSVGNNSEASSENVSPVNGSETHVPQSLAQTTDSPSKQSEEESSTAHTTGGSSQATVAPSVRPPRKATKATKAVPAPPRRRSSPGSGDDDF